MDVSKYLTCLPNDKFVCCLCSHSFTQKHNLEKHLNEKKCKSVLLDNLVDLNKIIQMVSRNITKIPSTINVSTQTPTNNFVYKTYTMPSGREVNYQGYEDQALDELLQIYNENDIENDKHTVPLITYECKGKNYKYYPDIYIKKDNLLIEVKSDWTYRQGLIKNLCKALFCRKQGYNFEFWIYYGRKSKRKLVL